MLADPLTRYRGGGTAKQYETRHFPPGRYGLNPPFQVAIHATATWSRESTLAADRLEPILLRCGARYTVTQRYRRQWRLPLGAVVGVATVIAVHRTESVVGVDQYSPTAEAQHLYHDQLSMGDYSPGRYAWELVDVQRLRDPYPLRGKQQILWRPPGDIENEIRRRVLGQTIYENRFAAW